MWNVSDAFAQCFERLRSSIAAVCAALVFVPLPATAAANEPIAGLRGPVIVERDEFSVPRVTADTVEDAIFTLGRLHAEDRLFQMDVLRRTFNGTLSEVFGEAVLSQDIELRTLGLDRAARRSMETLSPETRSWILSYTAGVNSYLNDAAFVAPPEYDALELSGDSIRAWTPLDTVTIGKGLAFGLSFDLLDLELTEALLTYTAAGKVFDFDGEQLFSSDLFRTQPFDPTVVITEAIPRAVDQEPEASDEARELPAYLGDRTLSMVRSYRQRVAAMPEFQAALNSLEEMRGSNWWLVSGDLMQSGAPALANDPHLDLSTAPVFYEAHLRADLDGDKPFNVVGVSFPGAPGIVLGCNSFGCWGGTVNPMDVVDVYQEDVMIGPKSINTIFDGKPEPVEFVFQTYFVNQIGDGVDDNLLDAEISELEGGITFVVPRRNNGPVVEVDISDPFDIKALSLQYTGWSATTEYDTFRRFAMAESLDDFKEALEFFDFGSQNWSWADREGNIAYFTSAELPLREDLQLLGFPDGGVAPYFIRDGTHVLQHEWLALSDPQPNQHVEFEILPFDEMPQLVNPERGYIISANNDPVGNTLDNNPLNEVRPGGGAFYLNPGYATGFRAGRIQQLFDQAVASGEPLDIDQLIRFQSSHRLLDAEVLTPYLIAAFDNALRPDAPEVLAALGADAGVAEAIGRLERWEFRAPTGIASGYDPGDDPENLPEPDGREINGSVAATIYSVWRGQIIQAVIDDTLEPFGLAEVVPNSALAMSALRHMLDEFDTLGGVGLSGIDFFVVDGVDMPEDERDVILLQALRDGLDLLAGDEFAAAFDLSSNQEDYRWGKLHRIVLNHPLGSIFSIPPAGALDNLEDDLPGLARSGGYGAVDASSHNARADSVDDFMFGSGPARRFIGLMRAEGVLAREVIPGGQSGVLGSPHQADQLRLWLTNDYHELDVDAERAGLRKRTLVPAE